MREKKVSVVAAQPGWYAVTLTYDYEVREDPVVAWLFEHWSEETRKRFVERYDDKETHNPHIEPWVYKAMKRDAMNTTLWPPSPVCLHGESQDGSCGVVKDPDGNYWLQSSKLTQEEAIDKLRMIRHTVDHMRQSEAAE
jgi:hypothetical protein